MPDNLTAYRNAQGPLPATNRLWPLYGAGFENLGREGRALEVPVPAYGPDELLVRHDACALCSSDVKVVRIGEQYPKIRRKMAEKPVVLGHELSLTIMGVGENLRGQYHVGDRYTVQPDLYIQGVSYAYGVELQGGLSSYGVVDWHVLKSDEGNGLVPLSPSVGYVEGALAEPWACVTAAYTLKYRSALKPGGTTWIIGTSETLKSVAEGRVAYTIGAGFDADQHPARLLLTNVPAAFEAWLRARAGALGVEVTAVEDFRKPPLKEMDDIILLGADPEVVEAVSPYLAQGGVFALVAETPMPRPVNLDVGRIHYNRWTYVGGTGPDVSQAYSRHPVRSEIKPGGRAWFVGAGGPMGRMHVQRAIQIGAGPKTIVFSDVNPLRRQDMADTFGAEAAAKGIELIALDPGDPAAYQRALAPFRESGFDDIVVLAPVPAVVSDVAAYAAPGGVINMFAGLARGSSARVDLSAVYLRQVRYIGQSGSRLEHMRATLALAESKVLSPSRSVAAIGSLDAAWDGLKASHDGVYSGRVVIFPHIKPLPLTALSDLKAVLPSVHAKLKDGREWTLEAEAEFLELMLAA
jgi:L-sorbose 1-phosphate reductase